MAVIITMARGSSPAIAKCVTRLMLVVVTLLPPRLMDMERSTIGSYLRGLLLRAQRKVGRRLSPAIG
jgi:hypothetical protein